MHYATIRKRDVAGYAHLYILQKWDDLLLENKARLGVYSKLYEIDGRLGTKSEIQLWNCCHYAVNIDIITVRNIAVIITVLIYFIFKFFENIEIDYEFKEKESGCTFFGVLFQQCSEYMKSNNWSRAAMKTNKFKKLVRQFESIFDKLTEMAEFEKNPEKMKKVLEMTSKSGEALIIPATIYSSTKIINYLLEKKIRINNCNSEFQTAEFNNVETTKRLIQFVNPKIINHQGESELYDFNPQNFPGSLRTQAEKYPNSIHVAVFDQECNPGCPAHCKSNMTAYYYINNVYIQRSQATQVGRGAFGTVFEGKWHGQKAVFKFIRMNMQNLAGMTIIVDHIADLQARLAEINKVPDSSNILKPLGHFRQQEQSQDEATRKYIADNSEVFVFKRCRMNLDQFRNEEYPKFQDKDCELLLAIMKQCLERYFLVLYQLNSYCHSVYVPWQLQVSPTMILNPPTS